jgi:hypothetical protein
MLLFAVLRRFFRYGRLTLVDAAGNRHLICKRAGPAVTLRIAGPVTGPRLLRCTTLARGEAYMDDGLTGRVTASSCAGD